jgi:hypothetical protein
MTSVYVAWSHSQQSFSQLTLEQFTIMEFELAFRRSHTCRPVTSPIMAKRENQYENTVRQE